ncbi:carcinoembryonic antigen-related cell adhesion molecule 5-like isoform X2 [Sebastes umbrosus]|uniref:carcinoembryonic antigen-related cell adhesion molecule 5-like isoform X2 n=1 Tax=Sebastes umbrosus TaxID=72105 RepID=UPI00189E5000|nr:carcinoembryonic antigen-related cell adhesion molecule 5-like isoform X2 [Sebastes umbrosus]
MDILPLLCIVSAAFTGLTKGAGVLPDGPLNKAVGETVMFTTTLNPPETPFLTVSWNFGDKNIITYSSANITAPEYEGRISFFLSTGSLELRNLTLNDSGVYSVNIVPNGGQAEGGNTRLDVYVPVSNVMATASSTDLVEFNSSVSLSCSSSGSSLSFLWLNSSSEVTASDRVQLTDGNSNLTIVNVTRNDQGPFRCHVFNLVSNDTSGPINFNISYGPENINLTISPSQEHYVEGSDISLMCSADYSPSAQFMWFLNGDLLSDTGRELRLMNIQTSQSGNYSCQAFNSKTLRYVTSQPAAISVLKRVANVVVTSNTTDLLEFNSSVSLSCSSTGLFLSFLWLNSSSEVTESDRVQLSDGGSTLTIVSVTRYDQGPFKCHVFNPVSNGTSDPVNLTINYGPENINLIIYPSQEHYVEGSDISLMCSAVSRPSAQFQWFLNGNLQSDTEPELRLMNIQMSQSGNYSCRAFNNKTMRYITSQPAAIFVLKRVANVVITSNTTDLLEFNSSVSLSCSSSGLFLSFLWLNSSSEVTESDRVQLSDGGSTLTIVSVTRYEQGPFRCHVFNPVSNGTSDPVNLTINYGPENINLIISPSQEHYVEGSDISLMCSAVSRPSAQFQWFLNGNLLSDTGPELRLINIQMSQSGNYSCRAFNNKTMRYEKSQPSVVSVVLERISGASITPSTNLTIEGDSVNLTCDAAGSVFTRKWMKGGSNLIPAVNMTLHDNNRVLSFSSLNKQDGGEYSCNVINPVSNDEASFTMVVYYGPENVQICGPNEIILDETLTLNCSAESVPASYTWTLNGKKIHYSAIYTKNNIEPSDSGNYTCEVMNYITKRTSSSAAHGLTVAERRQKNSLIKTPPPEPEVKARTTPHTQEIRYQCFP